MEHQTKTATNLMLQLNSPHLQQCKFFLMLFCAVLIAAFTFSAITYPKGPCDLTNYNIGFLGARYPVPNIIHFYRGGSEASNLSVSDVACIKAALRLQGPVFIHTDDVLATRSAAQRAELLSHVTMIPGPAASSLSIPDSILWVHGGVFMKNDVYLLRHINVMREKERSMTPGGDIIASTKEAVRAAKPSQNLSGVILDKDWGALYITDVMRNCTVRAVRLGTRPMMYRW